MIGRDFVKQAEDSRDASFVRVSLACFRICNFLSILQYTQFVDRHARNHRKTPDFELQNFFGQLRRSLLLELPSAPRLNLDEPTTVILALIREVKATLRDGIYYYKEFGVEEVVDMKTVQCAIGRVQDRAEWAVVDRSDIMVLVISFTSINNIIATANLREHALVFNPNTLLHLKRSNCPRNGSTRTMRRLVEKAQALKTRCRHLEHGPLFGVQRQRGKNPNLRIPSLSPKTNSNS
jgi:hypothetical protein